MPSVQSFDLDVGAVLAVALAVGHADHPTTADIVLQAVLLLFIAALLINVVVSVVAILREREITDPADGRASRFAGQPTQRSSLPKGHTPSAGSPSGTESPAE